MALSECSKHIKAACTEEFLSEALFLVEEELLELSNYHTSFILVSGFIMRVCFAYAKQAFFSTGEGGLYGTNKCM